MRWASASAPAAGRPPRATERMTTWCKPIRVHGLQRVERLRGPVRHGAVGAVPGADVAQNHEGGGLVLPALPNVGAPSLLAHRVEAELTHQGLHLDVVRAAWRLHFKPARFA